VQRADQFLPPLLCFVQRFVWMTGCRFSCRCEGYQVNENGTTLRLSLTLKLASVVKCSPRIRTRAERNWSASGPAMALNPVRAPAHPRHDAPRNRNGRSPPFASATWPRRPLDQAEQVYAAAVVP